MPRSITLVTALAIAAPALAGAPVNDDCGDALPAALDTVIFFDTTGSTTDGTETVGCFFNNGLINRDIWYEFVAPQSIEYRVSLCGSGYDSRLAVYEGCGCPPGSDEPIACDDDFCDPGLQSEVDFIATAGQCYTIRIGGYVSSGGTENSGPGQMLISAAPLPPANDLCDDAIDIAVDDLVFGTTTDAFIDTEFTGCGTAFVNAPGVWYRVIGTGTSMTASTCGAGTNFDTKLTIFCGGCSADICVDGNNNFNCTPPPPIEMESRETWCSRLGEPYLILVHGGLGDQGNFQLEVTASAFDCSFPSPCELPGNDDCAAAEAVSNGIHAFNTELATTDGPEHELCDINLPQINQDLWYSYVATCTGLATFSICDSGFDTTIAVYSGEGCDNLESRLLNCNDDFDCNGNGPDINDTRSSITIPVACGFAYLIRVGGHGSDSGGGNLEINCDGVPCPDPCPEDVDDNDTVDVDDLVAVILAWGPCAVPCPEDVNDDMVVDVDDLVQVILAWGPCQ